MEISEFAAGVHRLRRTATVLRHPLAALAWERVCRLVAELVFSAVPDRARIAMLRTRNFVSANAFVSAKVDPLSPFVEAAARLPAIRPGDFAPVCSLPPRTCRPTLLPTGRTRPVLA
jgi:hypothetical protein